MFSFSANITRTVVSSCRNVINTHVSMDMKLPVHDIKRFIRVPGMIVTSEEEIDDPRQRKGSKSSVFLKASEDYNSGKITQ